MSLKSKIEQLKKDIKYLKLELSYDIDEEHHKERMRLIKNKTLELKLLSPKQK